MKHKLFWVYSANLRKAYIKYGKDLNLHNYLNFHTGVRGKLEALALYASNWYYSSGSKVTNDIVQETWETLIKISGEPAAALFLYTDYYKETIQVGPIRLVDGKKYFVKAFKNEQTAIQEEARIYKIYPYCFPYFYIPQLEKRCKNIVFYELVEKQVSKMQPQELERFAILMGLDFLRDKEGCATLESLIDFQALFSLCEESRLIGLLEMNKILAYSNTEIPITLAHGDFVPWNVFTIKGDKKCLVDFERVGINSPFADYFHLQTQPEALKGRPINFLQLSEKLSEVVPYNKRVIGIWYCYYLLLQLKTDLDLLVNQGKQHKQLFRMINVKRDTLFLILNALEALK